MKAVVFDKIGSPLDVLRLAPVPIPEIADNEVLVKMISASINPRLSVHSESVPGTEETSFPGADCGKCRRGRDRESWKEGIA